MKSSIKKKESILNFSFIMLIFMILVLLDIQGCQNPAIIDAMSNPNEVEILSKSPAEIFIDTHNLGKKITLHPDFDVLLSNLPVSKNNSRINLARIDYFPLGSGYKELDKWDMALETGFIDGLLEKGLTVAEKLDHVKPRDPSEYIGTSPQDAFYMHGINLEDLELIHSDIKAPTLLTYQIMDFSKTDLTVVAYLRVIDIKAMKILTSGMIQIGAKVDPPTEKEMNAFYDAYDIVKSIGDFPTSVFGKDVTLGLLNSDILNITGGYKNAPSKKAIAIENGIITGLIHNEKYKNNEPNIMEKTSGFKLKYPSVYNSIVFNTSPILYEQWSEFLAETNCSVLMMYRYIPDYGLYIKLIDTKSNGRILYSRAFVFNGRSDEGIIENHNIVAELFKANVNIGLLKGKKILILDGDKQAVESQIYFQTQPSFNEMNLSIEEGMVTALVDEKLSIYEKLKTLYLKRPWMYNEKIFNLNPLYLDDWSQLKEFGVERLVVYNNLIPYEQLSPTSPDYKKVAIGVRIIDINTGDILDISELTNLN